MIRVLIADDHPFVRAGVAALLGTAEDVELIGETSDGAEVVRVADALHPDVIVMDVDMPVQSGLEATRELMARYPALRVVILSVSTDTGGGPETAARCGAVGYVLKGQPGQLVDAVRAVAAGGTAWPPDFTPSAAAESEPPMTSRGGFGSGGQLTNWRFKRSST